MNYLAHAYLSFHHPQVLVGNMIADFVKGRKKFEYPPLVIKGIELHRAIDAFTDAHPATRAAKAIFRPAVGLYAGAFADIVYDHFLALDKGEMEEVGWQQFSRQTYRLLELQKEWLPGSFAMQLPYMQAQDWLFNYRHRHGIQSSFRGLVKRAAYLEEAAPAYNAFETSYPRLQEIYHAFFPSVKTFAAQHFAELLAG